MKLKDPTLIFVCGWPMSGKTTLAEAIRDSFEGLHHIDIDEVRALMIGMPDPHSDLSEEARRRDGQEMGGAYRFVNDCIDWHLSQSRSILATATLSRRGGQEALHSIYTRYPGVRVRIIQCIPLGDTAEKVADVMSRRSFGVDGYKGGVNSPRRYFEVKDRYDKIVLPHLKIDTWGSLNSVGDELGLATLYIVSPQDHD